jgi:hypothetical protein
MTAAYQSYVAFCKSVSVIPESEELWKQQRDDLTRNERTSDDRISFSTTMQKDAHAYESYGHAATGAERTRRWREKKRRAA